MGHESHSRGIGGIILFLLGWIITISFKILAILFAFACKICGKILTTIGESIDSKH
jgi:hypothetical protein